MRTTGWRVIATTLVVAVLACSAAFGQRGFGRGRGGAALLQRTEVATELKLTDDQKTKARELAEKLREENQGRFQDLRDATPEERQKIMAEIQAEEMKRINAILNTDQQKRFRQIYLQQQGEMALAMPSIAEELKLTEDQKSKIRDIMRQQQEAQREIFQNAGGDREAAREKMEALRKETSTKLAAILTEDQKTKWKEMLGASFTLAPAAG